MSDDESRSSFQESEDDSDKELQEAFSKGLLKPGLNTVNEVIKRPPINNVNGLNARLDEFRKRLDWFERLDVTTEREIETDETGTDDVQTDKREDDFKRECSFYKQAQSAAMEAIGKLRQLGVVTQRPTDYYAEMAKTDGHMKKIREKLVSVQATKERSEMARKLRQERKFAVQIQRDVLKERQSEKKILMEAVKKHKKGFKNQLDEMLDNKPSSKKGNSKRSDQKRAFKDAKFGFGGRKKRSKYNTAESSAAFGSGRPKGAGGGGGGGKGRPGGGNSGGGGKATKQKRPGKSKRVKAKHGKGKK